MTTLMSYIGWACGLLHNNYGPYLSMLLQEAHQKVAAESSGNGSFYAPILNVGAVGACLIGLGIYYMRKDAGYEKRIDAMLEREKEFSKQLIDQNDKYRTALEKTNATMETMVGMLRQSMK